MDMYLGKKLNLPVIYSSADFFSLLFSCYGIF
jgi:hypothetical protein